MKKILVIVFLFCFYNSFAKNVFRDKIFISIDSLAGYPNYFNQHWKFKEGDDSARALFSYNDSSWKETAPSLIVTEDSQNQFKGIGWFRLHIVVDSTVIGKPLAMMIKHFGASQIYLDGKLIKSYGKINGADSTEYYNPQELPFIFVIAATGEHVIAVRYANYNALKNYQIYNQPRAGFSLMLGLSDHQISRKDERSTYFSFILMLLSGIFFALCLIHLFLFFLSHKRPIKFILQHFYVLHSPFLCDRFYLLCSHHSCIRNEECVPHQSTFNNSICFAFRIH